MERASESSGGIVGVEQNAAGILYENVGVSLVPAKDGYGIMYENVGVTITASKDAAGVLYENVLPPAPRGAVTLIVFRR
jgi:hypothetical protein